MFKDEENPPSKAQLQEEIEFQARMLPEKSEITIEDILEIYYKLEELGDTDRRIKQKSEVKSWFTGAFVHGGKAGPRTNVECYAYTSKLLVKFAKKYSEGNSFSAVGIARNSQLGLHRDSHNDASSKNMVVPLTSFEDGHLWIQDDRVEEERAVTKINPQGKTIKGRIVELKKGVATFFCPRAWHEVQLWSGDRVVMLMYTPRTSGLKDEDVEKLSNIGLEFKCTPRDESEEHDADGEEVFPSVAAKMLAITEEETFFEAYEEISDQDLLCAGYPKLVDGDGPNSGFQDAGGGTARLKRMIKKAEVQYTQNIEDVLHDLVKGGQQLQVTHTVSPQEVRKNLDLWKGVCGEGVQEPHGE